ncbi:MAG: TIGR00282 family metallophosphoesterase [Clostridiales bacterium]|nr:TIGR00282 family metallophosphoesterase [Clostridiales bacterium]
MKILTIGDVVRQPGCNYLRQVLPRLKAEFEADLVIVNGENSAKGNGVNPASAQALFDCGADVITLGNHALRQNIIYDYLDSNKFIIRPANYHESAPGCGMAIVDRGYAIAAVINIQGVVFMDNIKNPFDTADLMITKAKDAGANIILIDFHAEATSEKRALGYYVDGRASALFGTHTHVQTSDARVLPRGTGYITDLGMTGVYDSVLGVSTELVIKKLKTSLPVSFKSDDLPCVIEGCFFEIDNKTGRAVRAESFRRLQ